jgi:heme-degrading monooxygenase HmoA
VHASLTTVRGAGPEASATAGMAAESMLSWLREFEGYRGLLVLADPETGNARIVTFWDDPEAIERSERGRREVRESMIAAAGARLESVDRYELFLDAGLPETAAELPAGAASETVARFTTFEGPPESIEEGFRTFRDDLAEWFRDATGFRGWFALLDAPNGRSIGITLWAAAQALADEVASGATLRNDVAAGLQTKVTGVERYDLVMLDLVAPDGDPPAGA